MSDQNDKGLENLLLWQKAMAFAARIYNDILPKLPAEEKWAMASQLRRSATSIPANIAEGHGRFYYQDNVRFCYIARGSLEETLTYLILAKKLGYISEHDLGPLNLDVSELRKMLHGYITYLKNSKRGATEPGSMPAIHEDFSEYMVNKNGDSITESTDPDN